MNETLIGILVFGIEKRLLNRVI